MELFSIWVKTIIQAYSLAKKSQQIFALFKSIEKLMLHDIKLKKQIGKENPYLTENQFTKSEMWCAANNHNSQWHVTHAQKDF